MPLSDYPAAELQPRNLTKEEINDPEGIISDFFSYGHLPEIRDQLWELFKLLVSSNYHRQTRAEKANIVYFYERLTKVIEAIHIISTKQHADIQLIQISESPK